MKILQFLFLFFCVQMHAQIIECKVIDAISQKPVAHIPVVIMETKTYQLTNDEGVVSFESNTIENKTLTFSDIFYQYQEVKVSNQKEILVTLEPNVTTLEEVVILNKPVPEVLNDVLNANLKQLDRNIKMETYYSEVIYNKDVKDRVSDGLVDFYLGEKKNKFVKYKIKESRVRKDKTTFEDTNEYLEVGLSKPNDVVEKAMKFKELSKLSKNKNYEYHVTSKQVGDRTINTIYYYPIKDAFDKILISGYMSYDASDKKILEINFKLIPEQSKYANEYYSILIAKFKIYNFSYHSKFKEINGLNIVTYNNVHFDLDFKFFGKKLLVHNQILFYTKNAHVVDDMPKDKAYFSDGTLFRAGSKYTNEFWLDSDLINYVIPY